MKKIAVLGAGPMGLSVAYYLLKKGYKPVIYESDDRVGGMSASFLFSDLYIERFYHFHCTSDIDYFNLLEELGLNGRIHWVETKMGYWYQQSLYKWGGVLSLLIFKGASLITKLRYLNFILFNILRNDWQKLDKKDAVNWIKDSIGIEGYNIFWKKLFDFKFYEYSNLISAAWIWSRINRIGKSRSFFLKEKLAYIEGGTDLFLKTLKTDLELKGCIIHLSTSVERVLIQDNKVVGVQANGTSDYFDIIISTIPISYIPKIIPNLPNYIIKKYNNVKNISVVCVIVNLKVNLSEFFWLNVNDDTMDIPGIIEYTNLMPLDNNHILYIPFYMPLENPKFEDDDLIFINKCKKYIKEINHDISDEDIIEFKVNRYRHAQPICMPEHLQSLPDIKLPISGLFIADTSYYYPEDRGISESIKFGKYLVNTALNSKID